MQLVLWEIDPGAWISVSMAVVFRERAPYVAPFVMPDAQDFQEPAHRHIAGVPRVIEHHFTLGFLHASPLEQVAGRRSSEEPY